MTKQDGIIGEPRGNRRFITKGRDKSCETIGNHRGTAQTTTKSRGTAVKYIESVAFRVGTKRLHRETTGGPAGTCLGHARGDKTLESGAAGPGPKP